MLQGYFSDLYAKYVQRYRVTCRGEGWLDFRLQLGLHSPLLA
jgi:hypothetical protein